MKEKVIKALKENNFTISVFESLTGGLFMSQLVDVPGASEVFKGGCVLYTREAKEEFIAEEVLDEYGTISDETATDMASNSAYRFNTTIGVGLTGNAGPSAIEGKEVGLVYIAVMFNEIFMVTEEHQLTGSRQEIRQKVCDIAFELILNIIKENTNGKRSY